MADPRPAPGEGVAPVVPDVDAVAGGTVVVAPAPAVRAPLAPRHYLWIGGALLVVVVALRWLGPVLTPFLFGAILAYLGTPLVDALARRGVHRAIGTTLTVLLFGVALTGLFFVLVPLVQAEASAAAKRLPELVDRLATEVVPWIERHLDVRIELDVATLRAFVVENLDSLRDVGLRVLSGVRSGGALLVSLLVNLALIPVVMFYLLRDWDAIVARIDDLLPRRWQPKVRVVAKQVDEVLAEFLRGQASVMVVLALYYAIALSLVGLNHAVAIGVLTGLLVFIPYVGFGLGLALGLVAALLQWTGWPFFLAVAGVYAVGQLVENYLLVPWLVGDRIGLHPLAVIFALLAFGQLFGFAGVLLALPVSAALLVGLRHVRAAYVASPLYGD
ncbi:MAG: AI-2E family transporter [Betaproteobacteria bacterium]|nr:MAG: AI-2E family transporter [Betaproteobacteria bacterium]